MSFTSLRSKTNAMVSTFDKTTTTTATTSTGSSSTTTAMNHGLVHDDSTHHHHPTPNGHIVEDDDVDDDEGLLDPLLPAPNIRGNEEYPTTHSATPKASTPLPESDRKALQETHRHEESSTTMTAASLPSQQPSANYSIPRCLWNILRMVTCDVPLMLLFLSFLTIYMLRDIYHIYYTPLFLRAKRTNAQLLQEYTYYDRQCTSYDISTHNIQDLLVVPEDTDSLHKTVQQMLQHGAVVIPQLVSMNTTQLLRQYIVQKNARITQEEVYPMSQGYQRLSYGIDAAEHEHVSTAIQEIVHHPVLRPLLSALLGDVDPASAEITAIMNYYGAKHQVWHQDTKQDGNAIKFARTYSHSYSLFVPLQDITAGMGPTDICPGTQYCTNDLETMCEENKMGLHQVTQKTNDTTISDAVFPAGYGALLNQHVWHRGGSHVDEHALERIVFILSFVARPFKTLDDQRQLSRGTYFHQKWNMWGHTIHDLTNPMVYMKYPYSILRCLSIYKSRTAHWGYDLITATYMRFANGQLEDPDLADRFRPSLLRYGLPSFLLGRVLEEDEEYDQSMTQYASWTTFIEETIQNIYGFVWTLNIYAHGIYFGVLLLFALTLSIFHRSTSANWYHLLYGIVIRHGIQRTVVTHGIVALMALCGWYAIQSSEWSVNVLSGRTLQRPFPNLHKMQSSPLMSKPLQLGENSTMAATDPLAVLNVPLLLQRTIPNGYTTIPTRYDILFGTRYDAPFLGSYNLWLQYHPGNQIYNHIIDQYRQSFQQLYWHIPINETTVVTPIHFIVHQILQDVQQQTMRQGRFLQQNWATGDWHIVTPWIDVETMILSDLKLLVNHPIRQQINDQIAHHRFGPYRDTKLSQLLHLQLYHLRERMLYVNTTNTIASTTTAMNNPSNLFSRGSIPFTSPVRTLGDRRPSTMKKHRDSRSRSMLTQPWNRHTASNHDISVVTIPEFFEVGTLIWYNYVDTDDWIPGIVMEVYHPIVSEEEDVEPDQDGIVYDITTDDGAWYYNVLPDQLQMYRSVTENDLVYGCFESGLNDCYSGTVLHVYVSGNIRILYDDDDIYDHVPPSMYYIPPYRYDGPYQS